MGAQFGQVVTTVLGSSPPIRNKSDPSGRVIKPYASWGTPFFSDSLMACAHSLKDVENTLTHDFAIEAKRDDIPPRTREDAILDDSFDTSWSSRGRRKPRHVSDLCIWSSVSALATMSCIVPWPSPPCSSCIYRESLRGCREGWKATAVEDADERHLDGLRIDMQPFAQDQRHRFRCRWHRSALLLISHDPPQLVQ